MENKVTLVQIKNYKCSYDMETQKEIYSFRDTKFINPAMVVKAFHDSGFTWLDMGSESIIITNSAFEKIYNIEVVNE